MKVSVIIASAGKSERFGDGQKAFAKIDGSPVVLRTVGHFVNREDVCQTILVVAPADMQQLKDKFGANLGFMGVSSVEGGQRRCDSVAKALATVSDDAEFVAVHDAARPCVSLAMIDAVFAEAAKTGAAILAAPLTGTIKRGSASMVIDETVSRDGLYEAQTPQVFRKDLLVEAYRHLSEHPANVTDDAELVQSTGHPVSIVVSDLSNLKITTKQDLTLANAIIKSRPVKAVKQFRAFEEAQW